MGLGRIEEHPCVSLHAIRAANKQAVLRILAQSCRILFTAGRSWRYYLHGRRVGPCQGWWGNSGWVVWSGLSGREKTAAHLLSNTEVLRD